MADEKVRVIVDDVAVEATVELEAALPTFELPEMVVADKIVEAEEVAIEPGVTLVDAINTESDAKIRSCKAPCRDAGIPSGANATNMNPSGRVAPAPAPRSYEGE